MSPSADEPSGDAPAAEGRATVVQVQPDVSGIDRTFDYTTAALAGDGIATGTIVRVPLSGRRVHGWVLGEEASHLETELRSVEQVLSLGPAPELVELAHYGARRYVGRLRPFLLAGSPLRLVPEPGPAAQPRPARGAGEDSLGAAVRRAVAARHAVLRLPPSASRLAFVEEVLAQLGSSVLVLCPALAEVALLREGLTRAGHAVAVHPEDFALAAGGGRVVLGSRAAVFAPQPGISGIVVLDAHAEAYREERAPTWDATVLAGERARRADVPCLFVSPCPPLTLGEGAAVVELPVGEERAGWPALELIDRRGDDPRSGLYSPDLAAIIHGALEGDPKRRVVAVLNRAGRARLLACAACGELARCEHCGGPLSQRRLPEEGAAAELSCGRCCASRPVVCANCGARRMRLLRVGVGRAAEELAALVRVPVAEVSGAAGDPDPTAPLLVGTEAVLHRVRAASLVVFLDFDQELLAPRYRAAEQALALLVRAGRLVGGRGRQGAFARRVVVQTRLPDHEVLVAAREGAPQRVAEEEARRRRELGLPPFRALALLSGERVTDVVPALEASGLEVALRATGDLLVRAADATALADALHATVPLEAGLRVEVDPLSV